MFLLFACYIGIAWVSFLFAEIANLKSENRNLYTRISTMVNEQKDLEEQVCGRPLNLFA